MDALKLALVQMRVAPGQAGRNQERAAFFIEQAAAQGAQIVLLPEALPFGWMDPGARTRAEEIPQAFDFLRQSARRHGVFVCSGLIERAGSRIYNAAVLIDPDGALVLHHRKIHELEIAHDLYALGDRLAVADTRVGKIGLMICADAFAPGQVISRTLGLMGAQLILSPCAWAVPPGHDNVQTPYGSLWRDNYGPVARDFGLWIAGCSNVGPIESGPWAGHKCIGSSLVAGPDGRPWHQAKYDEEQLLLVEVPLGNRPRSAA